MQSEVQVYYSFLNYVFGKKSIGDFELKISTVRFNAYFSFDG